MKLHTFEPRRDGSEFGGPPEETCHLCGCDPRNEAHQESGDVTIMLASDAEQLALKLATLREAWLDLPFTGIVPPGWGDPIADLVNAATELVDPDRTLRETEEAKRRGDIATLRTKAEWYADQVAQALKCNAEGANLSAASIEHFARQRDEAVTEARERFGVELLVSPDRKPWTP